MKLGLTTGTWALQAKRAEKKKDKGRQREAARSAAAADQPFSDDEVCWGRG
jgi:hypothetical protein